MSTNELERFEAWAKDQHVSMFQPTVREAAWLAWQARAAEAVACEAPGARVSTSDPALSTALYERRGDFRIYRDRDVVEVWDAGLWRKWGSVAEFEFNGPATLGRGAPPESAAPVVKQDLTTEPAADNALVEWAVERWFAEVAQRPLVNVHRRTLDATWRQVIRHAGGDDIVRCGPRHDDLLATQKEGGDER